MRKDRIALQLYSVRGDTAQDLFGTLEKVRDMGYAGVEFAGVPEQSPQTVREKCRQLGLVPVSAHVAYPDLRDRMDEVVDYFQQVGCQYIVLPYLTPEYRPGNPGFYEVIDTIKIVGEKLAQRGMVLQYHNHDFEFLAKIDGIYSLDYLYREVGPELLQTQLDTCWVNVGGENPAAYVRKYAGRVPTVHLKDFSGRRSEHMYALIGLDDDKKQEVSSEFQYRPLGKGLQNIPEIIQAADESGADWFIVEQDNPSLGLTPMECAEISIRYLHSLLD